MADGPTGPDATFCAASAAFDSLVRGASVGVAVSGGSDSMALLALLHRWADGRDVRISAATVNHGLRVEGRAEAERVAAFCASRGIRHEILTLGDLSGPGNLSARARDARYAALTAHFLPQGCVTDAPYETSADAVGCVRDAPLVLLGHTMDDQAETVLMRLARGSGAEGLSAMASERHAHGIRWVRPLLALRRDALRDWLRAEGIAWIDDPTNADPRYDRVKARRALEALTPLGLTAEGVADTAARLARQSEVLRTAATELSAAAVSPGPLWSWQIDREAIAEGHSDTQLRIFAGLLQDIASAPYRPRYRALEPLWEWALHGADPSPRTLAGCMVLSDPARNAILIFREHAAQPPASPATSAWDGWVMPGAPVDTTIGPLGEAGRQTLLRATRDVAFPADWVAAPVALHRTLPALWSASGDLLAVPHAHYAAGPSHKDRKAVRIPPGGSATLMRR